MKLDALPEKYQKILKDFIDCYIEAAGNQPEILSQFLELLKLQIEKPFTFEPYHQKVRKPIDYYQFGLDFIRPLINLENSKLYGEDVLKMIEEQLKRKENVILFANHQTETDPQAISILLEKNHPSLAEKIVYVAGERVVTDPLAIPFSMGCDLLCIYSKRYIDHPPDQKTQKLLHNKKTMELMSDLLKEGGKIIYVAPSGGRDRKVGDHIEVAPFDSASIEMFFLMAKKAKTPTHFYPLTLATYDLLPPPETVQTELGEKRIAKRSPIHIAFSEEFDMLAFDKLKDKQAKREKRKEAIYSIVKSTYEKIY